MTQKWGQGPSYLGAPQPVLTPAAGKSLRGCEVWPGGVLVVASTPTAVGRRGPWGWEEARASHGEAEEKAHIGERGSAALDIGAIFTGRRVWRDWEARGVWGAVMGREDPCHQFGRHHRRHSCFALTSTPHLLE